MADRDRSASYRLTNLDASFLYQESTVSQMHGGLIFFLSGVLPFDRLFRHFAGRLHVSPRFRQRLFVPPLNIAHPTLEDDPDFKLENHVQQRELSPSLSDVAAVNKILEYNNSRLLDRTRPLWCVTLFKGLPKRTLVLWEMHHAIVDGVSGFDLLNKTMDFSAHPKPVEPPAEPWRPPPLPTPTESYTRALRDLMVEQIDAAARNAREFMRDPFAALRGAQDSLGDSYRLINENARTSAVSTPWNSGVVTEERRAAWLKFQFSDFRSVRAALGGTINDIVLAVLTEGAARYLRYHGWMTDGKLRIGCPVNVRRPDEAVTLQNRVSIMMPMTPAKPMDVAERLRQIAAETKLIKESGAPYAIEQMTSNNAIAPATLAAMGRAGALQMEAAAQFVKDTNAKPSPNVPNTPVSGINFMATNVPGPQTAWYLAGHEVTEWVAAAPLAGNLGLGVVITSYNQRLFVSLVAEPRLLPDLDVLKGFIADAFDELREHALHRPMAARPPQPTAAASN